MRVSPIGVRIGPNGVRMVHRAVEGDCGARAMSVGSEGRKVVDRRIKVTLYMEKRYLRRAPTGILLHLFLIHFEWI